jgi:hypothetical protein
VISEIAAPVCHEQTTPVFDEGTSVHAALPAALA